MEFKTLSRYLMAGFAMVVVYYSVTNEDLGPRSYLIQEIGQEATSGHVTSNEDDLSIYMMSEDELLVPVSIEPGHETNEIEDIFNVLTTQPNRLPVGVKSTLGPDVILHNYTLQNKTLTLNVSTEFLAYQQEHKRTLFESLVFTFTSIDGIEKLKFKVDGEPLDLTTLALDNETGLSQEMGINLHFDALTTAYMQPVTLYFYKVVNETEVLVPITHLIPNDENVIDYTIEHLKIGSLEDNYYTLLDTNVALLEPQTLENNILSLNFNDFIYSSYETSTISTALLEQLEKTFLALPEVKGISLRVNGEEDILSDQQEPVSKTLMPTISK